MNFTVLSDNTARVDGNIYGGWEGSDYASSPLGRFLNQNQGKEVTLYVTSNGGDVMAGLGLGALIASHGKVTVCVAGLVASAGTFLAANAKTTQIMENSLLLVHNTKGGTYGGAQELQKQADLMKKMDNEILPNMYVGAIMRNKKGAKKTTAELKPMVIDVMSKDLPLTAQECIELGFASKIITIEEGAAATGNPVFANSGILTQMPQESYNDYLQNIQKLMPEESEQRTTLTNFFQPMPAETYKSLQNLQEEDPKANMGVMAKVFNVLANAFKGATQNSTGIDFETYVKGLQEEADNAQSLEDASSSNPINNNQNNESDMTPEQIQALIKEQMQPLTEKVSSLTNSLDTTKSQLQAEADARAKAEQTAKDLQAKLDNAEAEKIRLQNEKAAAEDKGVKPSAQAAGADTKEELKNLSIAEKGRRALPAQSLKQLENLAKDVMK